MQSKAVFNVSAFQGVTIIQCNESMALLLAQFISEVDDDIEPEIFALKQQLEWQNGVAKRPRRKHPGPNHPGPNPQESWSE